MARGWYGESGRHAKAAKGIKTRLGSKSRLGVRNRKAETIRQLQREINEILYSAKSDQVDWELLTIVVLRSKRHFFDFLTGRTRWRAIGDWKSPTGKKYDEEKNVVLEIQFKDSRNEYYGKRLKKLINRYNKLVVGEELLYFRTVPVEETSLEEEK